MLHITGFVVWHDVPKLRNLVVIQPQWLADAMAGVVTFMAQNSVARDGGMTNWLNIQKSLKLKYFPPLSAVSHYINCLHRFPNDSMHQLILLLLMHFEIIYKMRVDRSVSITSNEVVLHDEQMFFVPSLLLSLHEDSHPAIQYWQHVEPRYVSLFFGKYL
jgi:hypothetical protein